MKKMTFIIIAVLLSGAAYGQQSDSEIVEQYLTELEQLKHELEIVEHSAELYSLEEELDALYEENFDNQTLINYSIYPNTVDLLHEELLSRIKFTEQTLLVIENQKERLLDLTNQIAGYRSEINKLNAKTDSLRLSIAASEASEARLSEMIANYRRSMEQRDELIFKMLDSLMINYDGYTMANPSSVNSEIFDQTISTEENPLVLISNLLDENITFTTANTVYGSVEEHMRMYALQNHFNSVWDQVGDSMIGAYGGRDRSAWDSEIQTKLRDWKMASARKMWQSIDRYLEFNDIELAAFDNSESFFSALDAYLNYGLEKSENEFLTSNGYSEYQKMDEFWSFTFKNEWNEYITDTDLLSMAQVAQIDTKLNSWEQVARPVHPALVVIVALLIVSLSGFILIMVKTRASKAY